MGKEERPGKLGGEVNGGPIRVAEGETGIERERKKETQHRREGGEEEEKREGVFSIAPVERKREWETDKEREAETREGDILGQVP